MNLNSTSIEQPSIRQCYISIHLCINQTMLYIFFYLCIKRGPSQERWIKHGRSASYGDLKIEKKKDMGKKKNTTYPLIFHASRMYEIMFLFFFFSFSVSPNLYFFLIKNVWDYVSLRACRGPKLFDLKTQIFFFCLILNFFILKYLTFYVAMFVPYPSSMLEYSYISFINDFSLENFSHR